MIHPSRPDDAFRRAAAREQLAALLDDMQNLTEYQRGALVMRELGGLTYDEIGSALETTPLAARQAVFVARRRLSEGPAGPRRLRPALLGLVAPAPAGFALASALGGASAGLGAKALATTAAVVTLGVGSVEIVQHADPAPPKREVAATKSQPRAPQRERAAKATPKVAPAARVGDHGRVRTVDDAAAAAYAGARIDGHRPLRRGHPAAGRDEDRDGRGGARGHGDAGTRRHGGPDDDPAAPAPSPRASARGDAASRRRLRA